MMKKNKIIKGKLVKRIKQLLISVLVLVAIFAMVDYAVAQQTYRLKAVGNSRPTPQFGLWTWLAEELEKRTNGQVKTDVLSHPELGLTGFEMIRVTKAGLVDFNDVPIVYTSADLPVLEVIDFPGLYPDIQTSIKAHINFIPVCKKYQENLGGLVLGVYLWPTQVLYSRKPIKSPADLKGLKVRVYSSISMGEFFRSLGAETVIVPTAETYTALERGTVDAALTGTITGFSLRWYEVSKYLVDVNSGPLAGLMVVSKRSWDKFSPNIKKVLIEMEKEFNEKGLEMGHRTTLEGIEGNRNKGMEWSPTTPAMTAATHDVVKNIVIPSWVKRSGPDAKPVFNEYIAPYVGFKIP